MRTTLTIDDDVHQAAKELAAAQHKTTGQVVSELARQALTGGAALPVGPADQLGQALAQRFGIEPRRVPGVIVTNELVNQIRQDEGV
ncbi:MAG: hypothetical protein LBS27_06125 [Bifidobacteriaceae bacterium]|jgi:hypothetical protein|nr:hypothetical protein [Bifidobacteriaceae bacterium]